MRIPALLLAIAVGVKLGSPGPVVFKQRRNGLDLAARASVLQRVVRPTEGTAVVECRIQGTLGFKKHFIVRHSANTHSGSNQRLFNARHQTAELR